MSIVKKFKGAALAAALVAGTALASSGASAATVFNLIGPNGGAFLALFSGSEASFTHTFEFTFGPGFAQSEINASVVSKKNEVNFTSIDLDGIAFTKITGGAGLPERWTLASTLLAADPNPHVITVKGQSFGNTQYTGNISLAAVPEPATWGMMLVGFGLVGAGMRSRKRSVVLA